jgi:hypothetical protein
MKLVVTLHHFGVAIHVGGCVESVSHVIDIPDNLLPPEVLKYTKGDTYECTMSLSYQKETK